MPEASRRARSTSTPVSVVMVAVIAEMQSSVPRSTIRSTSGWPRRSDSKISR
jgi:hypothetical protein